MARSPKHWTELPNSLPGFRRFVGLQSLRRRSAATGAAAEQKNSTQEHLGFEGEDEPSPPHAERQGVTRSLRRTFRRPESGRRWGSSSTSRPIDLDALRALGAAHDATMQQLARDLGARP